MRAAGAELHVEVPCATDGLGGPAMFFDNDRAFLRCKIDAMLCREGRPPVIIDWKTGKQGRDDPAVQLAINCLCAAGSQGPGEYEVFFVYVDTGATERYRMEVDVDRILGLDPELMRRSSMRGTLELIGRMREAHERGDFPYSRGDHCRWCDWAACDGRRD